MNTRGNLALAQITLLILGVIAVGWAIGSEVRSVSGISYLIQKGDTLSGIAQKYGISVNELRTLNPTITNPDLIYYGKTLNVPSPVGIQSTPSALPLGTYQDYLNPPADFVITDSSVGAFCRANPGNPLCTSAKTADAAKAAADAQTVKAAADAELAKASAASKAAAEEVAMADETTKAAATAKAAEAAELEKIAKAAATKAAADEATKVAALAAAWKPLEGAKVSVMMGGVEKVGKVTLGKDGTYSLIGADGTPTSLSAINAESKLNYEGLWNGAGRGFAGNLWEGLTWSLYVVGAIQLLGALGIMEKDLTNSLSLAAFGGIMAYKGVIGGIQQWGSFGAGSWGDTLFFAKDNAYSNFFGAETWTNAQVTGVAVGVVVGAIILYKMYQKEETETVSFTCEPWEAPAGGNMCEQCNKQSILPCSEYQCRSLGQSCEIVNKGMTDESCVWVNRKDVTPPVIRLWNDALSKNHKYTPDNRIYPPDVGTKIIYSGSSDGCIKAFTPLEFGIITDEPASCKLDYLRTDSFDNMSYYLGGTPAFLYNHTQVMSLPGSSALAAENISIKNNGEYSLFIRCKDSNGNTNTGTFVFRFCVEKGPDTTPPLIVATNLLNNMPISFNKSSVDFEAYTNEPATCRWSHLNQGYDKMETKMTCSSSVLEMNAQMVYKCKTELNGIKDNAENNFYIKCEDQPLKVESDRNRNTESYKFTIIGTKPLVINHVEPNGTIKDSTDTVKVTLGIKTLGGYQEGNSTCYYNPTQVASDYVAFFNTNTYTHTQDLWLPEGEYTYYLRCVDLGGNADTNSTTFKVETDTESPIVVRAYNEESNLKIITDEPAECVYGINDCVYDLKDGMKMSSIDVNKTQHYTSWDTSKTFYIKCQDKYGNQPYPNQCSITLRPEQEQIVEED